MPYTDTLLTLLSAVVGAAAFAVVFRTPRRYFLLTTLIGTVPVLVLKLTPADWSVGFASVVAAIVAGLLSHTAARLTRAPAQCFLIPGVILLVPGAYIYRAFTAALGRHLDDATAQGLSAVAITLGVSFGLLLANWLMPSRKAL